MSALHGGFRKSFWSLKGNTEILISLTLKPDRKGLNPFTTPVRYFSSQHRLHGKFIIDKAMISSQFREPTLHFTKWWIQIHRIKFWKKYFLVKIGRMLRKISLQSKLRGLTHWRHIWYNIFYVTSMVSHHDDVYIRDLSESKMKGAKGFKGVFNAYR